MAAIDPGLPVGDGREALDARLPGDLVAIGRAVEVIQGLAKQCPRLNNLIDINQGSPIKDVFISLQ